MMGAALVRRNARHVKAFNEGISASQLSWFNGKMDQSDIFMLSSNAEDIE